MEFIKTQRVIDALVDAHQLAWSKEASELLYQVALGLGIEDEVQSRLVVSSDEVDDFLSQMLHTA